MRAIKSLILLFLVGTILFSINTFETSAKFNSIEEGKTYYAIEYKQDGSLGIEQIINKWKNYSKKNNVNIGVMSYSDVNTITVYQTLFDERLVNILTDGKIPTNQNEFLSNYENQTKYVKTGALGISNNSMKYSMFFIDNAANDGVFTRIFIQAQGEALEHTEKFLSQFGKLKKIENYNLTLQNNTELQSAFIVFIILLILMLFFTFLGIETQRRKIALLFTMGMENSQIYRTILKKDIRLSLSVLIGSFFLFYIASIIFSIHIFFISFMKAVGLSGILFLLLVLLQVCLIRRSVNDNRSIQVIKGAALTGKLTKLNIAVTFLLTAILLIVINSCGQSYLDLKKEEATAMVWKQTHHIYRLAIGNNLDPEDEYGLYDENQKLSSLYKELKDHSNAFFVDASNFGLIEENPYKFDFELNIKEEKDIYGMNGNSILINENYLKFNPIESKDNIRKKIIEDENTLNILVPEKMKNKETMIRESMLKDFYDYKVKMTNELNEKYHKPLLKTKKKDLKINLIYVKNGQKYFTFNTMYGIPEKEYCIVDPLAVILNASMDGDFIGSEMTTSMYLQDSSNGEAFKHLYPTLQKTNTTTVVAYVESVFDELGYKTSLIVSFLTIYILLIIVLVIIIYILQFNQVYWYFKINYQRIKIDILHGKTVWEINKKYLLLNGLVNFLLLTSLSLFFHSWMIFVGGSLFTCSSLLLITLYGMILTRRCLSSLKRGG